MNLEKIMRKSLSSLPGVLAFCLTVLAGCQTQPRAQKSKENNRPNIVYILMDDLGYGDVDALNPLGKIKTPHLRQFAMEGMTFTEAHSSSAVSTPSRYNILTGRYNWRSRLKSGVLGGFSKPLIEENRLTVAQMLQNDGYQTAYVGKWHLGLDWARKPGAAMQPDLGEEEMASTNRNANAALGIDFTKPIGRAPVTLGFDEFFGISASLDMPPYTYLENDHVTAQPTITNGFLTGRNGKRTRVGPQAPGFNAEDVLPTFTKRAVEYIDHAAAAKTGKPFFLFVAFPTPHTPISPSVEWLGKSGLNFYADYVMESDACVGEVLDALKRNGLAKDTLVIFTSDNGCSPDADIPYLISHGHDPSDGRRGYKTDIFDGGHRVPLIIRWPARVPRDSRDNDFICLGDFMATCADLLGIKLPENAAEDSITFLPPLLGRGPGQRDTLVESSLNGSFAIRQGQWKLAFCPDSGGWSYPRPGKDKTTGLPPFQLFDLAADPAEKTNVPADHPDVVQRLGQLMRNDIVNGRSTPGEPQENTPVEEWPQTTWLEKFR
jgi:arylsulfatase A-like enzyme